MNTFLQVMGTFSGMRVAVALGIGGQSLFGAEEEELWQLVL